ncbi:MAG: DUF6069 family protein [Cytophagaceae bacterium]|nr:DUF6069 family protein [Cytophagaceae bacterium]
MTTPVSYARIALGGLKGILAAAATNAVLFLLFSRTGIIDPTVMIPNSGGPLTLMPTVFATIIPLVVATGVFMLLARFTKNPVRVFGFLVLAILLFSFFSPATIPGAPVPMVVGLEVMHIAAAVIIFFALRNTVTNRQEQPVGTL